MAEEYENLVANKDERLVDDTEFVANVAKRESKIKNFFSSVSEGVFSFIPLVTGGAPLSLRRNEEAFKNQIEEISERDEPVLSDVNFPEYVPNKLRQQIALSYALTSSGAVDPLKYNTKGINPEMEDPYQMLLITNKTLSDIEKELKKDNSDFFYQSVYKDVLRTHLDILNNSNLQNKRDFYINLGSYNRLVFITDIVDDLNTVKEVFINNLDYSNGKVNPETLLYYANSNIGPNDNSEESIKHIAALDMLSKQVSEGKVNLDSAQKEILSDLLETTKGFKESWNDQDVSFYESNIELLKNIKFDDVSENKNALKRNAYNKGYKPNEDHLGFWEKETESEENTIKVIADWKKKFEESLLENNAAYYLTSEKMKKKAKREVDMSNSSLFGTSIIKVDDYGYPSKTLYNYSILTGAINFTRSGEKDEDSYKLAALNARKNGWKTISLNHGGDPREAIQFLQNSIIALVDHGGYSYDDIKVPKKYLDVLMKLKEQSARMQEYDPKTNPDMAGVEDAEKMQMEEEKKINSLRDEANSNSGHSVKSNEGIENPENSNDEITNSNVQSSEESETYNRIPENMDEGIPFEDEMEMPEMPSPPIDDYSEADYMAIDQEEEFDMSHLPEDLNTIPEDLGREERKNRKRENKPS